MVLRVSYFNGKPLVSFKQWWDIILFTFSKRQSYDTKIGGSNTVPSLVASKITVTGKDSD